MTRKRIFVSHISAEKDLAAALKALLDEHFCDTLEIFVSSDRETIRAGEKWLDAVDQALKSAHMQIVLCSNESVGRPWVNFEAGAAWLRGIPVIPVCHSGLGLNDLPVPLGMLQGIECGKPESLSKLYDAVAALLKVPPPSFDLSKAALQLRAIEETYIAARQAVPVIDNPRVLCAASAQYSAPEYGFDLDASILEATFQGRVDVERGITGTRLMALLTSRKYDIVHLVLQADRDSGDLLFSDVDPHTLRPVGPLPDTMAPPALGALLAETQARLVVLATCHALLVAVEVAHITNMAACDATITGEEAAAWERCFYGLLSEGVSLYKAFDLTRLKCDSVPIRNIRKQDLRFRLAPSPPPPVSKRGTR